MKLTHEQLTKLARAGVPLECCSNLVPGWVESLSARQLGKGMDDQLWSTAEYRIRPGHRLTKTQLAVAQDAGCVLEMLDQATYGAWRWYSSESYGPRTWIFSGPAEEYRLHADYENAGHLECRSPYCECEEGHCKEGRIDMRGEAAAQLQTEEPVAAVDTSAECVHETPENEQVLMPKPLDLDAILRVYDSLSQRKSPHTDHLRQFVEIVHAVEVELGVREAA